MAKAKTNDINLVTLSHKAAALWKGINTDADKLAIKASKAGENKHVVFINELHKVLPITHILSKEETSTVVEGMYADLMKDKDMKSRSTAKDKSNMKSVIQVHDVFNEVCALTDKMLNATIVEGVKGREVNRATDMRILICNQTKDVEGHVLPTQAKLKERMKVRAVAIKEKKATLKAKGTVNPKSLAKQSNKPKEVMQYMYDEVWTMMNQANARNKLPKDVAKHAETFMRSLENAGVTAWTEE